MLKARLDANTQSSANRVPKGGCNSSLAGSTETTARNQKNRESRRDGRRYCSA